MSETLLYLEGPKPAGSVFMGQITPIEPPPNGRYTVSGQLSNAQALTLNSAPVDVVPAIAGKIIIPKFVLFYINYAVAYAAARNVSLRFTGIATDLSTPLQVLNTVVPKDQILWSDAIQSINGGIASGVDVRGTKIVAFGSADTTGGDPANIINYYIEYEVISRP